MSDLSRTLTEAEQETAMSEITRDDEWQQVHNPAHINRDGQRYGPDRCDWDVCVEARQSMLGVFGDLRSEATKVYPTIHEHVHAHADPESLSVLDMDQVVAMFRARLTGTMIQYGIVLDGEAVSCAEPHGLSLWHGSIDAAREDAAAAVSHATIHYFGELHDAYRQGGEQAVCELFESWKS